MSVFDGQAVSASVSNSSWLSKNNDEVMPNNLGFNTANALDGGAPGAIIRTQREFNSIWSFLGGLKNQVYNYVPTWTNNAFGGVNDAIKTKIEAILAAFDAASGVAARRAGRVALSNGVSNKTITFATPFDSSDYVIKFTIENLLDSEPIFLQGVIIARSASAFEVSFNAPTDSVNYILHWSCERSIDP
jgi:hypothetical protein